MESGEDYQLYEASKEMWKFDLENHRWIGPEVCKNCLTLILRWQVGGGESVVVRGACNK